MNVLLKKLNYEKKLFAARKSFRLSKNPPKESTVISNGGVEIVTYKSGKVLRSWDDLGNYKRQLATFFMMMLKTR
jgi:ribonuclease HIII